MWGERGVNNDNEPESYQVTTSERLGREISSACVKKSVACVAQECENLR